DCELLFERDGMTIVGRSGTILGTRMSGVRVSIPELAVPSRHLLINGLAAGPSAEFLKFIETSPVRDRVGGMTDHLQVAGNGTLHLKIDMPLDDLLETKVAGEFAFAGNNIEVHPDLPAVEGASGGFAFTDSGFTLR